MGKLLNKTFFKFLFGFLALVLSGFIVMAVTGYIASGPGGGQPVAADTHK